jgi:hypothetical protein
VTRRCATRTPSPPRTSTLSKAVHLSRAVLRPLSIAPPQTSRQVGLGASYRQSLWGTRTKRRQARRWVHAVGRASRAPRAESNPKGRALPARVRQGTPERSRRWPGRSARSRRPKRRRRRPSPSDRRRRRAASSRFVRAELRRARLHVPPPHVAVPAKGDTRCQRADQARQRLMADLEHLGQQRPSQIATDTRQVTPPPDAGQSALLTCNHAGSSRARDAVTGLTPGVTRRTRLKMGSQRNRLEPPHRRWSSKPVQSATYSQD